MKILFLFFFLSVAMLSFGQIPNGSDKISMSSALLARTMKILEQVKLEAPQKSTERKFIDFISSSLDSIRHNKSARIDTARLKKLFNQSKAKLVKTRASIGKLTGIDSAYKNKIDDYLSTLERLHNTRLKQTVSLIADPAGRELAAIQDSFYPAVQEMQKKRKATKRL